MGLTLRLGLNKQLLTHGVDASSLVRRNDS